MVGQRIGQYLLRRQVGQGGMGAVYEAEDESSGDRVALKIMRPEFARNREALTRFLNEARAATLIEHPSIVQILGDGRLPDGTAYLVMEFLSGETLSQHMRRYQGPMPEVEVRRIGWQLAGALAAAHRKSIIHRDLKPGNIMVGGDGPPGTVERVKLLDFGIAKLDVQRLNLEDPMTRTGVIMGTPHYMSPEQCQGAGRVDDRADVYSLGVILYQMLTGRLPFTGEGDGAVIAKHIYEPPPPPRSLVQSITDGMQELMLAMLIKDPLGRPSMLHVHRRLGEMGAAYGMSSDLSMTFEEAPPTAPVPEPMTVVHGLNSAHPPSQPSTLGSVTGQLDQTARPTRRPLIAGAVFAGLALLGAGGAIAFKLSRPTPTAVQPEGTTAATTNPAATEPSAGTAEAQGGTPTTKPGAIGASTQKGPAAKTAKPKGSVKKIQRGKPKKKVVKKGAAKKKGATKGGPVGIVD